MCDQRRRLSCEGINCGSMFKEPKSILELHINDKESNVSVLFILKPLGTSDKIGTKQKIYLYVIFHIYVYVVYKSS